MGCLRNALQIGEKSERYGFIIGSEDSMKRLLYPNRRAFRNPRATLNRIRMRRIANTPSLDDLYCDDCMEKFQTQVNAERPGHVWTVIDGNVVYMEDVIVEKSLGRKLTKHETVVHKNGNVLDNRQENLEVVTIEDIE